jgi:hypothetical protein
MKITAKMLNIPPYISVAWKDISSLHTKADLTGHLILIVTLSNATQVEVPNLAHDSLEEIFNAFAQQNDEEKSAVKTPLLDGLFQFSLPVKKEPLMDAFSPSLTHNPDQANLPNLPSEMLKKIVHITKAFGLEDSSLLPRAEPHCNCIYCQIIRSVHGEPPALPVAEEEEISKEDLKFRSWDIKQTAEQMYTLTNPLDEKEQYNVFLGTPLGCTCGEKNCEHIRAVLNT